MIPNTPNMQTANEEEASKILQTPKKTLQHWRYIGVGPKYIKVGRSVRYRLSDLQSFLDENTVLPRI